MTRAERKQRVLVIDDEPALTRMLKLALEDTGAFEVQEEHQGARAMEAVLAFQPHVILLDIIMPDIDGIEVAAQLQADAWTKRIPVIFLTAVVRRAEARAKHGLIGGNRFLAKPVAIEEVRACLRQVGIGHHEAAEKQPRG